MSTSPVPLLVSADAVLVAEVMRLAAAAGVTPTVVETAAEAWRSWSTAPLVLVGSDALEPLARGRPPRRDRVHVLSVGAPPDGAFREALAVGAETVAALPESEGWLVEQLTDAGDGMGGRGRVIGVVGGSGGAGASVWACALARALADIEETVLIDLDPDGAGVDQLLGADRLDGVRWDSLVGAAGRLGARSVREALPHDRGLAVLAWPAVRTGEPLPASSVREVVSAAARGFGYVVLDLPRLPTAGHSEVLARCDELHLVVALTVPGLVSATRTVPRLTGSGARVCAVGRGRGVTEADLGVLLGVPVAALMADQRGLDEALGLGAGPSRRGVLARAAARCARALTVGEPRRAVA